MKYSILAVGAIISMCGVSGAVAQVIPGARTVQQNPMPQPGQGMGEGHEAFRRAHEDVGRGERQFKEHEEEAAVGRVFPRR